MPDDNMSAEQEEEMSEEELDALYDEVDTDDDSDEDNGKPADNGTDEDDADEDDEEEEEEDDSEDDDDDESDEDDDSEEDEDDDDDDEEEEEEEDDDDPLSEVKAQAAALKQKEQSKVDEEAAKAERAEKMSTAKDEVLKELFGQDSIKIGDKEVDLKQLSEEYGEDIDTLITARAYQIAEPLVAKAMEAGGFASKADMDAIKAENDEFRFMSQVAQTHPEIWQLKSDDKFWGWVDEQGEDVASLIDKGGVAGVSTVIAAYKKASITKTNAKIDKSSSEKKKKHTSLHTSTARSKSGRKSSKSNSKVSRMSAEEEAATFDEIEVTD